MKKVIMFVMLFMLAGGSLLAQWTTYTFRLYDNAGAPITGEEANIKFTRYPHVYANDQISGITVDEDGTTGIYMATGFTTLEYARIWLSGVARSKPDSVLVGNLFTYINTVLGNYVNLTGTQTISGTKTFGNGNISGDWLQSLGTFTMYGPKINTGATIYSSYGSVSSDNLIWLGIGDSLYGRKPYFLDGSNIRLNTGYKLYGRTNMTAPINVNTSHFSYSGDMLSLLNPSTTDSLTIKKDTTISEATYSKLWSIKRRFFSQRDSMDLYWYYKNTYANTSDSFAVINKIYEVDNGSNIALTIADARLDSLYLGPGSYSIDFGVNYTFTSQSLVGGQTSGDSIVIGLNKGTGVGNILKNNIMVTRQYLDGPNADELGVLSWRAMVKLTTDTWIYIVAKRVNAITNFSHIINRQYILATRIN